MSGHESKKQVAKGPGSLDSLLKQYPGVQLATLVDAPPQGEGWLHELKLDGYRLLAFLSGSQICLRTRNGLDWTAKFPSIVAALGKLEAKAAVVDMEAVVLDGRGKSGFQALQAALGAGGNRDRIVAYAFDLLHLDGKDLTRLTLLERKTRLESLLEKSKPGQALRFSKHVAGSGAEMLATACALGLEGIVSKLAEAPYKAVRDKNWVKSKCEQRQELIIVGYSDARSGGRAIGALFLGYQQDGGLRYAGKVGTGFSIQSAKALRDRMARLAVDKPVFSRTEINNPPVGEWSSIHWLRPELVGEVAFTEWTDDGHIRHPSFQGLREDKKASEVRMEKPAAARKGSSVAAPKTKKGGLVVGGVVISNHDRIISDIGHVTKGELAEYHAAVAPFMLAQVARHPLSLLRCPEGIGGGCFYQRSPGRGLGPDVRPFEFRHKGKKYRYLYIEDMRGLVGVIQMGAIELHPWGASVDAIDFPDRLIFDLDPAEGLPFEAVKLAAQDLRQRLQQKGLESSVKCTGGKGLHVTVPLAAKDGWDEVKSFASDLAHEMVADVPSAYVATMTKAKRTGKIFIDFFRNDYTATAIADFSVRARPGAPVALPVDWKELKSIKSANQFTMKEVLKRLKKKDPAPPPKGQRLPAKG